MTVQIKTSKTGPTHEGFILLLFSGGILISSCSVPEQEASTYRGAPLGFQCPVCRTPADSPGLSVTSASSSQWPQELLRALQKWILSLGTYSASYDLLAIWWTRKGESMWFLIHLGSRTDVETHWTIWGMKLVAGCFAQPFQQWLTSWEELNLQTENIKAKSGL